MPEKREDSYQTTSIAWEKNGCKNNKCKRIHLNVHVQKKKKINCQQFQTHRHDPP